MSADLFEAFGQNDQAASSGNKGAQKQSPTPSVDTTTDLISDFSTSTDKSQRRTYKSSNVTKIEPIFQPSSHGGNDVLFDASEEALEGEDDFGDFENVTDPASAPTRAQLPQGESLRTTGPAPVSSRQPASKDAAALVDLLSLDEPPAQHPSQPQIHFEPVSLEANDYERADPTPHANPTLSAAQPSISEPPDEDEGWGDFEAIPPCQPAPPIPTAPRYRSHPPAPLQATTGMSSRSILRALQPKTPPVPKTEITENWDPFEDGNLTVTSPQPAPTTQQPPPTSSLFTSSIPLDAQRPTNIPPPTILLSLLPTTFQSLVAIILSGRTTPDLPAQITTTFRVSARLISTPVRTLRWRRDTLLSQSTRIGVAGKPGGMKLSSLNKGETVKEEREAAEAVEAWNSKIHHFSKVLKSSGTAINLRLSMNMPVKPLTGMGVIQAAFVCPLCGLKRSERVIGVDDVGVEDVFGEYWLENWGHRECAEWWYWWNGELGQR